MNQTQRKYIKNRTNRRLSNKNFKGANKRKGLGRRKPERYSYYAYIGMLAAAITVLLLTIAVIGYNMAL